MKIWEKEAIELLKKSLEPFPQELNELDWKLTLSAKTEKLAKHLSGFANYNNGGYLVFGIDNGNLTGISRDGCEEILRKLGNIARQNLIEPIVLDHAILSYKGKGLLFVRINEVNEKPIHLRNGSVYDSYIRSAGETRQMDKQEVASVIAKSQGLMFEDGISKTGLSGEEVLKIIDFTSYFDLADRAIPDGSEAILDLLSKEKLVRKNSDIYDITNLGAILFAKNIEDFENISRKAVRVIIYEGKDKLKTFKELNGKKDMLQGLNL